MNMNLMTMAMTMATIILIFLIAIGAVTLIHASFCLGEFLEARAEAKSIILRAEARAKAKKILSERDTTNTTIGRETIGGENG